jgi:LmbE family N-acetylglucosaminyl deacetylase
LNILAVVAHPDDEILGCGGTLRKLADEGHSVFTCVLCAPADARFNRPDPGRLEEVSARAAEIVGVSGTVKHEFRNIQFNTVPHIEMVQAIESAIRKFKPGWIFTHHPGDVNIDHRVCYETTISAAMLPQRLSSNLPTTMIRKIFLFEVLSSTDWSPPVGEGFRPNSFFDISNSFQAKLDALDAFDGALKPAPHSRSRENVERLAHLRGAQVGLDLAEAFCLVRDIYCQQ